MIVGEDFTGGSAAGLRKVARHAECASGGARTNGNSHRHRNGYRNGQNTETTDHTETATDKQKALSAYLC
jgi:hypothetical protein